jgi:divalent metal cation (Fe/Co/Zn/Cd) transporter
MFASSVVVWHVRPGHPEDNPGRTRLALRMVALAFMGLGIVLVTVSVRDLATGRRAGQSIGGVVYLSFTAVVMFGLASVKKRTAQKLQSAPLRSEAAMTFLDGILSTLTLIGLSLNVVLGWAWADPLAALFVGLAAINESRENWREAADI